MHQLDVPLGQVDICLQAIRIIFVVLGIGTVANKFHGAVRETRCDLFALCGGQLGLDTVFVLCSHFDAPKTRFLAGIDQLGK